MREALRAALARAMAAGADAAEVTCETTSLGFSRFAGSRFTQSGDMTTPRVRVRVTVGGTRGAAQTTDLGALDACCDDALAAARALPPEPSGAPGVAGTDAGPLPGERLAPATLAATPETRAGIVGQLFAALASQELEAAGCLKVWKRERTVLTSAGLETSARDARLQLELIATGAHGASGYASFAGPDIALLEAAAPRLAAEASACARRNVNATALPAGKYDVILAPAAVAELLDWLVMTSFSARAVLDGMSLLCAHPRGSTICDPRIDVAEDPTSDAPELARSPIDAEGTPRRRVSLIARGTAGEPLSDRATARIIGSTTSTGHAPPLDSDLVDAPEPAHLVMAPGDSDDLGVDRGLYVTRLHYVNGFLDPRRAVMTGLTRDGTFLIEDGKLGAPVGNARWTDSVLDALSPERLIAVGKTRTLHLAGWAGGQSLVPALAVRGWQFE